MLQYNGQCYRYSTTYIVRMVVSGAGVVEGTHTIQNTNSKMSLHCPESYVIGSVAVCNIYNLLN